MDSTRGEALRYVLSHAEYGDVFQELTGISNNLLVTLENNANAGPFSDEQGKTNWFRLKAADRYQINKGFADIGKIIAAYEETLVPTSSMFDQFVTALVKESEETANKLLNDSQRRGAKLFIDPERTQCMRCHNGPLLSNREFHNIATGINYNNAMDFGRLLGLQAAIIDPFNCTGRFNDGSPQECQSLKQVRPGHLDSGAFKTPSLRHVAHTAPYMHDGRFSTLEEVMAHYLKPSDEFAADHEMPELTLTDDQVRDLIAFLKIL